MVFCLGTLAFSSGIYPQHRRLSLIRDQCNHSHQVGALMSRIFITGSADGLGRATAESLLAEGHQVVVHARSPQRLDAMRDLRDGGALAVIGDLSDLEQTRSVAEQANRISRFDAVIHNAGVYLGGDILPVNVVAPYVLTALVPKPSRLV
jgi:NAD(P)-dependent dehydrogenase (short-subunit alcohol dehydrogenase family)